MDIEEQLMRTMIKMDLDQKLWMLVVAEDERLKVGSERRVVGGGWVFKDATVPSVLPQIGPSVNEEARHRFGFGTRREKKVEDLN